MSQSCESVFEAALVMHVKLHTVESTKASYNCLKSARLCLYMPKDGEGHDPAIYTWTTELQIINSQFKSVTSIHNAITVKKVHNQPAFNISVNKMVLPQNGMVELLSFSRPTHSHAPQELIGLLSDSEFIGVASPTYHGTFVHDPHSIYIGKYTMPSGAITDTYHQASQKFSNLKENVRNMWDCLFPEVGFTIYTMGPFVSDLGLCSDSQSLSVTKYSGNSRFLRRTTVHNVTQPSHKTNTAQRRVLILS